MNRNFTIHCLGAGLLACLLFASPLPLKGTDRWQFEVFGGVASTNPGDLNLLAKAEEQYNDINFIRRLGNMNGYFVNDFPRITSALPAGLRVKFKLAPKMALALTLDGVIGQRSRTVSGGFGYQIPSVAESHQKTYDPFRLRVSGYSLLAGFSYEIPVGRLSGLEIGAAAGWTKARFDFLSAWTYELQYEEPELQYGFSDAVTLEGDGSGQGPLLQALLRLNRMLGRHWGFFLEAAANYCRIRQLQGGGRESRQGIPDDLTWQGTWGIKREKIKTSWHETEVLVPTNFWDTWTAGQRQRDLVLDLSGLRLVIGLFFRI